MMKRYGHTPRRQQGMTLVIGLIMLIMVSLAAVASYQMSKTSTEVIGNMQFQNEAVASADNVIQEVLSTVRMFETPTAVLTNTCNGPNTKCFDYNNDGTDDVEVTLETPDCVKVQPRLTTDLDLETLDGGRPLDEACTNQSVLSGIEGGSTGVSLCSNSTWEITAVVTDVTTKASVRVTQGADVQIKTTDAETSCL
jgi:Tfp pilus assembly protein PilX